MPLPDAASSVAMACVMFVPAGRVMFRPTSSVLVCSSFLDAVADVVDVAVTSELPAQQHTKLRTSSDRQTDKQTQGSRRPTGTYLLDASSDQQTASTQMIQQAHLRQHTCNSKATTKGSRYGVHCKPQHGKGTPV